MTTQELAADPAGTETVATALPAPDDYTDLEDAEDDAGEEDEDDGPDDPAEQARLWREAAAEARAERARVLADAEERKRAIDLEARSESQRLDREAGEADATAAEWQVTADQAAQIAGCESQAAALQERRKSMLAEEAALTAEDDQLGARLAEFAAAREEARQRLASAPGITDVGQSVAAMKDAMADLSAVEQAEAPSAARLQQVRARLAEIRGNEVQRDPWGKWLGPATGLAAVDEDLALLGERLKVLRRKHAGLPPEGEAAQLAMRLIAEAPVPEEKAGMARILALGQVTRDMERLAQESPEEYARIRDHYLRGKPTAPEPWSKGTDEAGREYVNVPAGTQLMMQKPDGSWSYGGRVGR
jgi:hypothetical protein